MGGAKASGGASTGKGGSTSGGHSGATSGGQGGSTSASGGHSGSTSASGGHSGSTNGGQGGEQAGSSGFANGGDGPGEAGAGGEGGSVSFDRWADCPTADAFEDLASWPDSLEVTEGAVYCATFDETRTLKEELGKKALLRVTPGSYRLPAADREGLGLPVCVAFGEQGRGVAAVPTGTTHQANPYLTNVAHRYTFAYEQPNPARQLTVSLHLTLPQGTAPGFLLDGGSPDPFEATERINSFLLCDSQGDPCFPIRDFDSCTHANSRLNRHQIELANGSLTLDVRIGTSAASTEPGAFVAARGTFRGVAFEQTNYFKLIYRPAHHHFERDFAVLFDQPIDGACGLQIQRFSVDPKDPLPTAATVDCELDTIEALTARSATLTRDP